MTTTFNNGTTTLTAVTVDGYSASRDTESIIHNILGTTQNAVTLRGSGLRKGSLKIVCGTGDTLVGQFDSMFQGATTITMADTDRPWLGMKFVATGHELDLDDDTREVWIVNLNFEEVT